MIDPIRIDDWRRLYAVDDKLLRAANDTPTCGEADTDPTQPIPKVEETASKPAQPVEPSPLTPPIRPWLVLPRPGAAVAASLSEVDTTSRKSDVNMPRRTAKSASGGSDKADEAMHRTAHESWIRKFWYDLWSLED